MREDSNCLPVALAHATGMPYREVRGIFHREMPDLQFTADYFRMTNWFMEGPKLWKVANSILPLSFGPSAFYIPSVDTSPVMPYLPRHRKYLLITRRRLDLKALRHIMCVRDGHVFNIMYRGIPRCDVSIARAQEELYRTGARIELVSPIG